MNADLGIDGHQGGALSAFSVDPAGGRLTFINREPVGGAGPWHVDRATGQLSLLGHQPTLGRTPRNFTIEPAGERLLVANQDSGEVVAFGVDQETGQLTS